MHQTSSESLASRFRVYQGERFPLAAYAPLTAVFTFSAAAYSRLLRGAHGFIPWPLFLLGSATALVFFFLLRVLDEHKDAETDRRYRPELPVPRGLIKLSELRLIAGCAVGSVVVLNALLAPVLLWACLLVALWAALMTREFFVPEWLRARPTAYLVSHMVIMPMIDGYTTGLDWLVAGHHPAFGLWLFLIVTFLNGTLMEIGRKIRAPEQEREGVDTYSAAWGLRGATIVWLLVLTATAVSTLLASRYTGGGPAAQVILALLVVATGASALRFLRLPSPGRARGIEIAAGLWVLGTYLLLGLGPFVGRSWWA
jgi:hypothetical protein